MQDEVTKHTKKIYDTVRNSKHTFGEKVKEVIIEIFIIVFAVTLSIWLHSWSEHRQEQKETKQFLENLKTDLTKDIESLNSDKANYEQTNKDYSFLAKIEPYQVDSILKINKTISFPINLPSNKINDGNYEGFKSSGKLGYIENEKLNQLLIYYYQKTVPNLKEVDDIYKRFIYKIFDLKIEDGGKTQKQIYLDPKLKEALNYVILFGENNIRVYEEYAITTAKEIIVEIDKQERK